MRRPGRFRVATESGHRAGVARKGVKEPCSGWLATADADLPSLSHGDRRARGDSLGMRGLEGRRPSGTGDVHPSPSGAQALAGAEGAARPAGRAKEGVGNTHEMRVEEREQVSVGRREQRQARLVHAYRGRGSRAAALLARTSSGAVLEGRQPSASGSACALPRPDSRGWRCPSSSISATVGSPATANKYRGGARQSDSGNALSTPPAGSPGRPTQQRGSRGGLLQSTTPPPHVCSQCRTDPPDPRGERAASSRLDRLTIACWTQGRSTAAP